MERYFDVGFFFRDVEGVLALGVGELLVSLEHAGRIARARAEAARQS